MSSFRFRAGHRRLEPAGTHRARPPGGAVRRKPPRRRRAPALESWIERSWRRSSPAASAPNKPPLSTRCRPPKCAATWTPTTSWCRRPNPLEEAGARDYADTRYFAILTNQAGVVVDVDGRMDRGDSRADVISAQAPTCRSRAGHHRRRRGADRAAAGLAAPGEHFSTRPRSTAAPARRCAGPDGQCAGMLDLTGIEVAERPELKHLITSPRQH